MFTIVIVNCICHLCTLVFTIAPLIAIIAVGLADTFALSVHPLFVGAAHADLKSKFGESLKVYLSPFCTLLEVTVLVMGTVTVMVTVMVMGTVESVSCTLLTSPNPGPHRSTHPGRHICKHPPQSCSKPHRSISRMKIQMYMS